MKYNSQYLSYLIKKYLIPISLAYIIIYPVNLLSSDWQNYLDSTINNYNHNDIKAAIEWGEKSQKQAETEFGVNSKEYEKTLFNMVDIYFSANDISKTLETAKLDSSVSKSVYGYQSQYYCGSLNNLGLAYYYLINDYNSSEKVISEAKQIQETIPDLSDSAYAVTLNNLSLVYVALGKFSIAEPLLNKAIERKKILDDSDFLYRDLIHNLAALYKMMGKYKLSDTLFRRSVNLTKTLQGEKNADYANELNNIGDLYKLMGKYEEAEPIYKLSIELRGIILGKKNPEYAKSLSNLALLYYSMGRYKQAEPLFKECAQIQKDIFGEQNTDYASSLNNLALLYETMGNNAEAESLYLKVLEIYKTKLGEGHQYYANTLDNLAKLYNKTGKFDESEKMFIKAKNIFQKTMGENHPRYARTLFNLGRLYESMGKYKDAELLYKQTEQIRKNELGEDHPDFALSLRGLAVLYDKMKQYDDAEPYFVAAVSRYIYQVKRYFPFLSEREKLEFWISVQTTFEDFNSFAAKYSLYKPDIVSNMYNNTLITKGLILSSTKKVLKKIRQSKDKNIIALLDKWQNTKDYWLWLTQNPEKSKGMNVDSIAGLANEMEKELSATSEDFKNAFKVKDITWEDIRNNLKADEAAIEIIRFKSNSTKANDSIPDSVVYAALIIKSDSKASPEIALIEDGLELETDYIKLYGNLVKILKIQPVKNKADYAFDFLEKDEEDLYLKFWDKVQQKLDGINRIYLSLDGVYNSINLLTLKNPKSKNFLIDEMDIRILTNTGDLIEHKKQKKIKEKNTAVLFGDPAFNLKPYEPKKTASLPGTKKEIDKIASDMKKNNWKVEKYLEEDATELQVKAVDNPKILHIATHGYFQKDIDIGKTIGSTGDTAPVIENPLLRSMLIFAGYDNPELANNTNDGKLTAFEAMDLNLNKTEAVVLSACETGLGEVKNGEGVYGLQRAFQVAGARSLVMSLWTVNDEVTQMLMSSFYQKMLNGVDRRIAFRETQLEIKLKYPDFYYWGAFVMVGE